MPFSSIRKPMTWVSAFFRLTMTKRLTNTSPMASGDRERQRGLGEGGHRHLPARAPPAEGRPGIERWR